MSQQTAVSPQLPSSVVKTWASFSKGGNGIVLFLLFVFLIVASFKGSAKQKKAGAMWASPAHKRRAITIAIKQIKRRKTNEVAVILDTVEKISTPHLQTSALFIGKPKTGKSWYGINLYLKALVDNECSILLFDYKYPDQTSQILSYAAEQGYQIDLLAPTYEETGSINLVEAATSEYASVIAETMVRNFTKNADKDPFFGPAGILLTEAVLMLAREMGGDIVTAQAILSLESLVKRIQSAQERMSPDTYAAFGQFLSSAGAEETASSIAGTASINFARFAKRHIAPAFVGQSNIPVKLEGKRMVVLGCRYTQRQTILPILAAIAQLIVDCNVYPGRKTPLACVFDEFPTLYLGAFQEQINAIRSYGVFFLLGIQNLAQLALTYGKEEANSIYGAIGTKHIFNPGDEESAVKFSKIIGDTLKVVQTESKGYSKGGKSSNRSPHREWRPLITADEILSFPEGRRIIFNECVGTKKKGFIPYITTTGPNSDAIAAFTRSEASWPHAQEVLTKRYKQEPYTSEYMGYQRQLAEACLPLPTSAKNDPVLMAAINSFGR
jgi:type IV secretory pathway TraG/TraD family ATPase VirD4